MTYQVTLNPSGRHFAVAQGDSLLEAGLAQNVGLPYGCKSGACGSCKAKVLTGEYSHGSASDSALPAAERALGFALLCCASAHSDLTIEVREVAGSGEYPVKIMPARVEAMTQAADDVIILRLKLPASDRMRFRPGQYVDILLRDGKRRSFSIANPPHDAEFLELHIRRVPGGQFTDQVFNSMKLRDITRLEGPLGSFFLRDDSTAPVILLAGGTGFAPLKAIIEHAIHEKHARPMHLYWGASDPAGLYLNRLAVEWAASRKDFRYTPVLSAQPSPEGWSGRTGLVHQALMSDYADLSSHQVYACGSPAMIDAARRDLTGLRALPADAFFSDAFTFSTVPF
jgi:CDP-4-dehydro-6-deoxyglucose reductase, E3